MTDFTDSKIYDEDVRVGDLVSKAGTEATMTAVVLSVPPKGDNGPIAVEMADNTGRQFWAKTEIRVDKYVEEINGEAKSTVSGWPATEGDLTVTTDYSVLDQADMFLSGKGVTMKKVGSGKPKSKGKGWKGNQTNYVAKNCKHLYDPFDLGDGTLVYATAKKDLGYQGDPRATDQIDCAVYLASEWTRSTYLWTNGRMPKRFRGEGVPEFLFIDWPDMSVVPLDVLNSGVEWALHRMDRGLRLGTGCIGAHGRTGSFLAALLIKRYGLTAAQAITKVRKDHCKHAIETKKQEDMIGQYEAYV